MNLKIIYEPSGKAKEYAELAVNLYKGRCGHQCDYCYAPRALHTTPDKMSEPVPKEHALELLTKDAAELRRCNDQRHILMSFTTDPYQPIEDKLHITRTAIEILLSQGLGISILTKGGHRSERDFDLLTDNNIFAGCPKPRYGATLVFIDDFDARKHEPFAASTSERIDALKKAHDMGIYTWVSLEPVWYPTDAYQLIQETYKFVDEFKVGKLNYMEHAKNVNWKEFAIKVEEKLKACGANYYLKSSLRELMGRK